MKRWHLEEALKLSRAISDASRACTQEKEIRLVLKSFIKEEINEVKNQIKYEKQDKIEWDGKNPRYKTLAYLNFVLKSLE